MDFQFSLIFLSFPPGSVGGADVEPLVAGARLESPGQEQWNSVVGNAPMLTAPTTTTSSNVTHGCPREDCHLLPSIAHNRKPLSAVAGPKPPLPAAAQHWWGQREKRTKRGLYVNYFSRDPLRLRNFTFKS